jgi:hypothetical protein
VAFADELTDVELAAGGHLGRPGVAEVGIVLPYDDLGRRAELGAQVLVQRLQGLDHVPVP